jgi:sulfate adenylyltransferase
MNKVTLDDRQLCDLEMLLNGGFAPLNGFLTESDYISVLDNMHLKSGEIWPIPIVLRLEKNKYNLNKNDIVELELLDSNKQLVAKMNVYDIYEPNLDNEFEKIYGSTDDSHDYIKYVKNLSVSGGGLIYVGGDVQKMDNGIVHYNFNEYRKTPSEMKTIFNEEKWESVLGFQTRNPMHKSHYELTKYALNEIKREYEDEDVKLLLNPVIGITQKCDVPYEVRVRCYIKLLEHYPKGTAKLCLLPLSMRMAGPREALWHALIRQNYGCSYFVVGRDHAGPSAKKYDGTSFFGPYDAHNLLEKFSDKLNIKIIKAQMLSYVPKLDKYIPANESAIGDDGKDLERLHVSGTRLREMLRLGDTIPDWFTFPEIAKELQSYYPPINKQGFCIYFIGLSGCGKTTLSKAIMERLRELINDRHITMLDGDIVRENLGQLGFSRKDRSLNVRRIGYMAQTIVKNRGISVCANIAPYREDREYNRNHIDNYVEVYLSTPISVCEERDVKGLYKKARTGEIPNFTGISDPFEKPEESESDLVLSCDSADMIDSHINTILDKLREKRLLTF